MKKIVDMEEWKCIYIEQMDLFNRKDHYDAGHRDAIDAVDDWLDAQPDAEEEYSDWEDEKCENCGAVAFYEESSGYTIRSPYCPNCGKKMKHPLVEWDEEEGWIENWH